MNSSTSKVIAACFALSAFTVARSDEIRDELATLGVELEDKPGGTVWKLRS